MRALAHVLLLMLLALPTNPAHTRAQTSPGQVSNVPADAKSQHAIEIGGQRMGYAAVAGTLPLFGAKAEVAANIFYTAYVADPTTSNRPITFVFNGGPGAASAFLHLGAMGPRAVAFTASGAAAVQPVTVADNPDTWLDFTDLVFVDPVGTGYTVTDARSCRWRLHFHQLPLRISKCATA
jgi:carboxypeptidase C (cathepsin A)